MTRPPLLGPARLREEGGHAKLRVPGEQLLALLAGLLRWKRFVCWAQTPAGTIEGTITDPSQAAVPHAAVAVTESATGRALSVLTNNLGRYSIRDLPPGLYTVRVSAPRFTTTEISGISVSAGGVVTEDVRLTLGSLEQVVSVAASAVAVDAVRQTLDTVIGANDIRNIPLFGRNYLDLAALAPGVIVRDGQTVFPTKSAGYRAVGISGRSGIGTRVQIDGIDVTDPIGGSTVSNISSDAVHEFQLSRSSLDISSSMTSSGTVSIISKSGGNEIHGTGFWDYYNQDMGARLNYLASSPAFPSKPCGEFWQLRAKASSLRTRFSGSPTGSAPIRKSRRSTPRRSSPK